MNAVKHLNLVETKDVSNVLGMARQNFNGNYINKPEKEKITRSIIYGVYMMIDEVTPEELIIAKKVIIAMREAKKELEG